MSKIDVAILKRPRRSVQKYEFQDEANPGQVLVLWLRPLDILQEEAALDRAEQLAKKYITGGFKDERTGQWMKEPLPFHAVDGEPVTLSERAMWIAAKIEMMQSPPDESDRYSAEELLSLAPCMPKAWSELLATVGKYLGGQEGWSKKGSEGSTAPPSGQPSTMDSSTP